MARNSGKLSKAAAIAVSKIIVQQMKYLERRLAGDDRAVHAARELAIKSIEEIYYEGCSDAAQESLRALTPLAGGGGRAALMELAGWV